MQMKLNNAGQSYKAFLIFFLLITSSETIFLCLKGSGLIVLLIKVLPGQISWAQIPYCEVYPYSY
jgi:hypothetical protein